MTSNYLRALKLDVIENEIEHVPLYLEWDNVRIEFQKVNQNLKNLRKRFPSSRIQSED
jgi:hypothetical protein